MSQPASRRFGRFRGREPKLPSERDWERSALLVPRPAPRLPQEVSDGGGLPFTLAALEGSPVPLDPDDGAAGALLYQLKFQAARRREVGTGGGEPGAGPSAAAVLEGWRTLARTQDEVLFGLGRPPRLVTVAVRREGRRGDWVCAHSSASQPLRATRDGIRASSWRLDPTQELAPGDTVLRVLVTEQAFAGGQRADRRVLEPDMYAGEGELVLRMFITPRPGFQSGSPNPETPVRVALPEAVGERRPSDGAFAPDTSA
jgi:hypothetical protein